MSRLQLNAYNFVEDSLRIINISGYIQEYFSFDEYKIVPQTDILSHQQLFIKVFH